MARISGRRIGGNGVADHTFNPYMFINAAIEEEPKYTVRDLIRNLLDTDLDAEISADDSLITGIDTNADGIVKLNVKSTLLSQDNIEEYASRLMRESIFNANPITNVLTEYEKELYNRLKERHGDENKRRDDWEDLMG